MIAVAVHSYSFRDLEIGRSIKWFNHRSQSPSYFGTKSRNFWFSMQIYSSSRFTMCVQPRGAIRFFDEATVPRPRGPDDNGEEFRSHFRSRLEALDIRHLYSRPRTPSLNGKSSGHIGSMTRSFINVGRDSSV
jgi:hypothetical protein